MALEPRPCAICGEPFTPGRAWARYCGREECRRVRWRQEKNARAAAKRAQRPDRTCAHCGGQFTERRADARYCSSRCQKAAVRERSRLKRRKPARTCATCRSPIAERQRSAIYCSPRCQNTAKRRRQRARERGAPRDSHAAA